MKRSRDISVTSRITGTRGYRSILAIALLVFLGCATVPPQSGTRGTGTESGAAGTVNNDQRCRNDFNTDTIAALVELLKQKNVISAEEASRIIERSKEQAVARYDTLPAPAAGGREPGGTPSADESARYRKEQPETQEDLSRPVTKEELLAAAPEWIRRIRFGGDIRLRYENDRYDDNNADFAKPSDPTQLMNTHTNQDKMKYRVRFGAEAKVTEDLTAVVRLSTGNTTNPVSTNTIMGDYLNKDNVVFDLAYLKWRPFEFLTVYGGRIPNPWFAPSRLVWDDDLNFEGIALTLQQPVSESWTAFLTGGAFPLNEYEFSSRSKWLTAGQIGMERKDRKGISAKIGAAYYYFFNVTGMRNDPDHPGENDWTAPLYQQKGNTLFNISADPAVIKTALASYFKELNVGANLDIGFWDPYHVVLSGDYVKNFGFDKHDVAMRTGNPDPDEDTTGYQIGLSVGYPSMEKSGQWRAFLQYKNVGADAVIDAFTDSDFHLGGTNAKGWILGAEFALWKNVWLATRWLTADEVSGPPLAIDVLFMDFNARF